MADATASNKTTASVFWQALENVLMNQPQSLTDLCVNNSEQATSFCNSGINTSSSNSEEILKMLNSLKQEEPIAVRLKALEDIVKLADTYNINENVCKYILKSISDLLRIEYTIFEHRKLTFEHLIRLIGKKPENFDTFLLRNYLLSLIIINLTNVSSRCLFLRIINSFSHNNRQFLASPIDQTNKSQKKAVSKVSVDQDIRYRFELFFLITNSGTYFSNLDPELTNECLIYFLENANLYLYENNDEIFNLFKNLIDKKYFQLIGDDSLLNLLTRHILNFSYLITIQIKQEEEENGRNDESNKTNHSISSVDTSRFSKQIKEIKLCVDLVYKIIDQLSSIDCINHVVLCLCELLDLTSQSTNTNKIKATKSDSSYRNDLNEVSIRNYECMNKLFMSPIGNCAIFTFFNEIFPVHTKHQSHRTHQINGALMHIKQIFEDFKSSKIKNTHLIKELHLNCLIYLPNALKSYITEMNHSQKFLMFENIINLTIELVNLATHRDLYMCLLTFNSRKFLIEIVDQFSDKILENEILIKKYAELLNLLDLKEVFSYKTSKEAARKETIDEAATLFHRFKEAFYELVYKFPHVKYLKDNCINNCIEYYFQRKLLPCFGVETIKGIMAILDKYLSIKMKHSLTVRRYLLDSLHKKLKEYYASDQKIFTEDIISTALLPIYEKTIQEDNEFYHSQNQNTSTEFFISSNDYFEMKHFIVTKLIELTHYCNSEMSMFKIIKIFEKIILLEKTSSIELIIATSTSSPPSQQQQQPQSILVLSPPATAATSTSGTLTTQTPLSSNLYYLNKIINNGLIEIFEKHFSKSNQTYSKCCVEIFNILTAYLDYHYTVLLAASSPSSHSLISNQLSSRQQITNLNNLNYDILNQRFFNYYAAIRRDIVEFLLRMRSDQFKRLILVQKMNRRKHVESKYLMLTLNETRIDLSDQINLAKCQIDFGKILNLIEQCLDKETDWQVLMRVFKDLPYLLQYEMDLITKSHFTKNLFRSVVTLNNIYKKEINIRNKPENFQRIDLSTKFLPLIASLILYHPTLDRHTQENMLSIISYGINSNRNRFCLETIIIAITEMHEKNSNECGNILLKLSQFSPSQIMAQPVLELLSTMSDFERLDFIFGRKELYISVLAIAIKYTNPSKFNAFIIQLAHYVICIWFIKCKPEMRKNYASFTFKGLQKEVLLELELQKEKDIKSPTKQGANEYQEQQHNLINLNNSNSTSSQNKDEVKVKNALTDSMKTFYKELVQVTMDFMSNNMHYDNSINAQLTSKHNRNEFFVDIYSNTSTCLRTSSLIESNSQSKAKGLTRLWLVGNKIVEIKTGLFSNICLEDPSTNLLRKQRTTNNSGSTTSNAQNSSNTQNSSTNPSASQDKPISLLKVPTQAIDIPNAQHSQLIGSGLANDSIASSNNSSTSMSNNNSFSSASLNSNYKGTPSNGSISRGITDNNATSVGSVGDHMANRTALVNKNMNVDNFSEASSSCTNKSEKDFFDETIGETAEENKKTSENPLSNDNADEHQQKQSNETCTQTVNQTQDPNRIDSIEQQRRTKLTKRRYKSGLPLSTDRSDYDSTEESYLKQFFESSLSKQSKDDSVINTETNKNSANESNGKINRHHSHHHHHHHHHHRHSSYRTSKNDDIFGRNKSDEPSSAKFALHKDEAFDDQQQQKKICHPNCWCNNLVEITCRYPTKIVTYVSLIENNNSTSHFINTALFDKLIKSNKLLNMSEISSGNGNSVISASNTIERPLLNTNNLSLARIAANAIESRRNSQLSRISESSMLSQDMPSSGSGSVCDNNSNIMSNYANNVDSNQDANSSVKPFKSSRFNSTLGDYGFPSNFRRSVLSRKGSFDLSSISSQNESPNTSNQKYSRGKYEPQQQSGFKQPLNESNQNSKILNSSFNLTENVQNNTSLLSHSQIGQPSTSKYSTIAQQAITTSMAETNCLDPSQVFLQLFQNNCTYADEKDQPLLIPENDAISRSIKLLDYMASYMLHKIGVIYVGKNQINDEKAILSNSNGSLRYKNFVNGLGNLIYLKDMDTLRYYSGGLETDGSLGDFTVLWSDGIIQISFHVSTMMLIKDGDLNSKKRHLGNDSTLIVYNESGEEYQFSMIKGEINCICIEIIPLANSNTNIIKVKTTNEIAQSTWFSHSDPKFVSDENLALIVRKMALHADMASKIYRSQKDNNLFGGKWYERLKQINRIRKLTKEHYAKQQPKSSNTGNTSINSNVGNSSGIMTTSLIADNRNNSFSNLANTSMNSTNSNISQSMQSSSDVNNLTSVLNQSDFTNYI